MGLPADVVHKMSNDFSATATFTDLGNGNVRFVKKSDIDPHDITFKFNEEFDMNVWGQTWKVREKPTMA